MASFGGAILDHHMMTTPPSFSRVCVLLPRMTDDEAAYHDAGGEGGAWATRLFGAAGLAHIGEFGRDRTVVAATCELDLVEALMWIDRPSRLCPAMGANIIEGRLADDDLPVIEPGRFQFLEVLDLAVDNLSVADIEQLIGSLPFKSYRIERGRTAPLAEAEVSRFDWRPELPGLQDHEQQAA
jgi:hypothetical protein